MLRPYERIKNRLIKRLWGLRGIIIIRIMLLRSIPSELVKWGSDILNLILPCVCVTCEGPVLSGKGFFCDKCRGKLMSLRLFRYQNQLRYNLPNVYYLYHYHPHDNIDMGNAVRTLKYKGYTGLASEIAGLLSTKLEDLLLLNEADIVTSVPLHPVRRRERGYNQSELIARSLAKALTIPYIDLIRRIKNTRSQAELKSEEREYNVKAAFKLKEWVDIRDKTVIILDDQVTTGATIDQAAEPMYYGGAAQVIGLSVTH